MIHTTLKTYDTITAFCLGESKALADYLFCSQALKLGSLPKLPKMQTLP